MGGNVIYLMSGNPNFLLRALNRALELCSRWIRVTCYLIVITAIPCVAALVAKRFQSEEIVLAYLKIFLSWPMIVFIFGLVVAGEWLVILCDRGSWKLTRSGFEFTKHEIKKGNS